MAVKNQEEVCTDRGWKLVCALITVRVLTSRSACLVEHSVRVETFLICNHM